MLLCKEVEPFKGISQHAWEGSDVYPQSGWFQLSGDQPTILLLGEHPGCWVLGQAAETVAWEVNIAGLTLSYTSTPVGDNRGRNRVYRVRGCAIPVAQEGNKNG